MEVKEYCIRLRPVRDTFLEDATEEEGAIIGQHFHYLQDLTQKGVVVLAGRTEAAEFGLVIFRAESDEAAQQLMANDPAIVNNVFNGELFPFRIALLQGE